ncbi:MAG: DUF2961 domain-containing protein [Bacteroidetes bacterium]|nr:DUF2961 domain-containing protein [Bacteroidota bacterium]
MKNRSLVILCMTGLLALLLHSCTSTYNKADIENILSPGSLPNLKESKLIQVSTHDTTGGNQDMVTIPAGKEATIFDVSGPGIITRMWFQVNSSDPYYLRRVLLKIYWDNEDDPSVEVPLGDFFGSGYAYRQYVTPYLGMSSGGFTCFFPMPFEDQARMVVVNQTGQELKGFYAQIDYQKLESPLGREAAYFHASWHRDVLTDYDTNYTILKTKGKGHIVGVNMSMQSYDGAFNYLEGREWVFVDGEKKPSIYGTGTEDYFSSGWYFNKGEYAGPYNGLVLKDDSLGRISAYRFHILDPIPFKKSIDFSIEHGYNNTAMADYSSTVYWYQMEPHVKYPPMLKSGFRIPLRIIPPRDIMEAEKLNFNPAKIRTKVMDMSDYGAEWSGSKQMLIETGPRDQFSLNIGQLDESGYDIYIYYTKGPDYGNVDVFMGSEKVGQIKGYAPMIMPGGDIVIRNFTNPYNALTLTFVNTGKDSLSSGYNTGLDGIKLDPKRSFIPVWKVIGPFPNLKRRDNSYSGMDSIYRPEASIDMKQIITGLNGKTLHWQEVRPDADGYVSFDKMVRLDQPAIFYALAYIYSPEPRLASLFIGSDDGIKVYYNYTKVFTQRRGKLMEPDQGRVFVKINKGWNKLLLKIENRSGRFGFFARIPDRENIFKFNSYEEMPASPQALKPAKKK